MTTSRGRPPLWAMSPAENMATKAPALTLTMMATAWRSSNFL